MQYLKVKDFLFLNLLFYQFKIFNVKYKFLFLIIFIFIKFIVRDLKMKL